MSRQAIVATHPIEYIFVVPEGVTLLPVETVSKMDSIDGVQGAWRVVWATMYYYWDGEVHKVEPTTVYGEEGKEPASLEIKNAEEDYPDLLED